MKKALALLALISSFAAASAKAESPFSANDLSYLMPIDAETFVPKFDVTAGSADWKVLSEKNLSQLLAEAKRVGVLVKDKQNDPKTWHLVAFRYNPCEIFAGKAMPCKEQVRFVFQSLGAERQTGGFDDYAVHVVYDFKEIKSPERSPLLEAFRALKNKYGALTLDKALQVSPSLKSAEGQDVFSDLQSQVIAPFINVRKPTLMTFMGLHTADDNANDTNSDHWIFFKGDVNQNGDWTVTSLPTGHKETFDSLKLDDEGFEFLSNIKTLPGQTGLIAAKESKDKNALKIFDSKLTNDHNVDCASCHIADRMVFTPSSSGTYEGAQKESFVRKITKLASGHARVSEILLNGDSQVGRQGYEVPLPRIFGYLDGKAVISQRMAFDSAYAVEAANKVLGLKEKPQCNSENERRAFVECLYMTEYDAGVAACLKKACK